jgi:hypothetical protein
MGDLMESATSWKQCLEEWPESLPRNGVAVTKFDQIPFSSFLTSENMVVFERKTPDTVGARFIMSPYSEIAAIKFVDALRGKAFNAAGFSGKLTRD